MFVSYTKSVVATNIGLGWHDIQTFTVENKSNETVVFDINWTNIKNEFTHEGSFTYSVKRNGILEKDSTPAPKTNSAMLSRVVIPANTTYYYEIEYKFNNLPIPQDEDAGKSFSARLEVVSSK